MVLVKLGSKIYHKSSNYSIEIPDDVDTKLFVGLPNGYVAYVGNAIAIRLTTFGKYVTCSKPTKITTDVCDRSLYLLIWYSDKFEVYDIEDGRYICSTEEHIPPSPMHVWLVPIFGDVYVGVYSSSLGKLVHLSGDKVMAVSDNMSLCEVRGILLSDKKMGEYSLFKAKYHPDMCHFISRGSNSWLLRKFMLHIELISDISEDGVGQLIIKYDGKEYICDEHHRQPIGFYSPVRYTKTKSARN